MKVCHLTSVHPLKDTRIFFKECKSLAANGYEVYLVGYGDSIDGDGVNIIGLDNKPKTRQERIIKGARRVVNVGLSLDCQIYHLHDPELIPYISLLKRKGKKVVFDSHEDIPAQILEKDWLPFKTIASKVYGFFEKRLLAKADALIYVTPSMATRMKSINEKSYLVTNYPIIEKQSNLLPKHFPHGEYISFIGGVVRKWNHHSIVKALQKVKGISYLLYGNASPEYIHELKELDNNHVLNYQGTIPHESVHSVYKNALAGVSWLRESPNVGGKEGTLGVNKLFEQMMSATPVIVSDLRLWREIIEKYNCGIVVNQDDINGFADAVQFLKQNPEIAKEMGDNGYRAVLSEFNWKTQERELIRAYKQIM